MSFVYLDTSTSRLIKYAIVFTRERVRLPDRANDELFLVCGVGIIHIALVWLAWVGCKKHYTFLERLRHNARMRTWSFYVTTRACVPKALLPMHSYSASRMTIQSNIIRNIACVKRDTNNNASIRLYFSVLCCYGTLDKRIN